MFNYFLIDIKYCNNISNTKFQTPKAKRFKAETVVLYEFLFLDLVPYSNLQILYEILKNWEHRLDDTFINKIADFMVKVGKMKIKE